MVVCVECDQIIVRLFEVGAFELDGEMIDAPTVKQAQNVLARAKASDMI